MWNVRGEIKSSIKRSLKRKIVTFLSLSMIASSMTPPSVIMADELDEDASFIEETQEAEEINDSGYEEPVLGTEDLPDDSTSCDQGGDHEWEYVANNHNYCETPRINTYRCKKCGKTKEVNTGVPDGHDWILRETVLPSCTEDGYKIYECPFCWKEKRETVSSNGHDFVLVSSNEATCEEKGVDIYKCMNPGCNETEKIYMPSYGHQIVYIDTEGGCETPGYYNEVCSVCHKVLVSENKPPKGHNLISFTVPATCTEQGYTVWNCTNCSYTKKDNYTDPIEHKWMTWVTPATCSKTGLEVKFCSNPGCTLRYEKVLPKEEHELIYVPEILNSRDATREYFICHNCNQEFTRSEVENMGFYYPEITGDVPTHKHDWDEGTVIKEATCSQDGIIEYTCKNKINGIAHSYTESVNRLPHTVSVNEGYPATCSENGLSDEKYCTVCGEIIEASEVIPALGHDWDEGTVIKEATCSENGLILYTCSRNNLHTKTVSVDRKPHTISVNKGYPATCSKDGLSDERYCTVCGEIIEPHKTIPALGHDLSITIESKAVTCLEDGIDHKKCSRCDYEERKVTHATGHNWSEFSSNNDATCTKDGTKTAYCKNDPSHTKTETDTGSALGHKPGEVVVENRIEPSYTRKGSYDEVVYCERCNKVLSRHTVDIPKLVRKASDVKVSDILDILTKDGKAEILSEDTAASLVSLAIPNTSKKMEYTKIPVTNASTWNDCTEDKTDVTESVYAVRFSQTPETEASAYAYIKVSEIRRHAYKIHVYGIEHGKASANALMATEGDDVILTVIPDEDYEVDRIDSINPFEKTGNNEYTAKMPNQIFIIKVYFKEMPKPEPVIEPEKPETPSDNNLEKWLEPMIVSGNEYTINIATGQKKTFPVFAKSLNDGGLYKITSDNKKIATMNSKGQISAKKVSGNTTITVQRFDHQQIIHVNVYNPTFKEKKIYINAGDTVKLDYENCGLKPVIYTSKPNVAGVSTNTVYGAEDYSIYVTGYSKGSSKIIAYLDKRKASITVKVIDPVISGKNFVVIGKTSKLKIKNGVKGNTTWTTSDPNIATIDEGGRLTGVNIGEVTVTAINNGKTISKKIKVVNSEFGANDTEVL